MFPNPQAALPLPPRPSLEQYKKRAKDLVKACRSGDPDAIRAWAREWLGRQADEVAEYARTKLTGESCVLADAQFVIARSFGFASWPKFASHIESLERDHSPVSTFESAVDAVVRGDDATLARLLREHPDLVRAQSTREHHATLLIYTSANGVEGYRQKSPKNAPAIAQMLLDAGAEVDATAACYGGECTTLGLVATSSPPDIAGVQIPIMELLLQRGSRLDLQGSAGNDHTLVRACLANGQPAAAAYLADRGAPLDIIGAAGLGRLETLRTFFDAQGQAVPGVTPAGIAEAFATSCAYGQQLSVEFLLDRGFAIDTLVKGHGEGSAGLHVAAYHGHIGVVEFLIARGANVNLIDKTWKTPPIKWVLTAWVRKDTKADACYRVVARLVRAGALVTPDILEWDNVRVDPTMQAALRGIPQT